MAYYEGYDYQGYQDPYSPDPYNQGYHDPYSQDPYGYGGYEGYNQDYGFDAFQPDGSPPPPPDKNWEDPVLLNRSYLEKTEKNLVSEDYKGLNDVNMYIFEVFIGDFEVKNELADSELFKDKNAHEFFTSVKILHCPYAEVSDTTRATKRSSKIAKNERVTSYNDLFQTVYTEADRLVSYKSKKNSLDTVEREGSASVSEADVSTASPKTIKSSDKKGEDEEPPKDTTTYPLQLGKTTLFTMTGFSMIKCLMKHEIVVRLSERTVVEISEEESEDETDEEVGKSSISSTAKTSKHESAKSSKETGSRSVESRRKSSSKSGSMQSRHDTSVEGSPLGTATVRLSRLYHQAVLQSARPDATPPVHAPENRAEELKFYPLVDDDGEQIGSVGISIVMTCFGRAAVNCVRENANGGLEFEHTLFLSTSRFEPTRKAEEPPRINAELARFLLKLGPVAPASKTSTEILQECLDGNRSQVEDTGIESQHRNDCDWNTIARRIRNESVRLSQESKPSIDTEAEHDMATRWIDLRRTCREMQEKTLDDNWNEPKEKGLYERLEEMRMSKDDSSSVEEEDCDLDSDEGVRKQRSSSAKSYSNSLSLLSNNFRKKTM